LIDMPWSEFGLHDKAKALPPSSRVDIEEAVRDAYRVLQGAQFVALQSPAAPAQGLQRPPPHDRGRGLKGLFVPGVGVTDSRV
jgi:hypothetical protein